MIKKLPEIIEKAKNGLKMTQLARNDDIAVYTNSFNHFEVWIIKKVKTKGHALIDGKMVKCDFVEVEPENEDFGEKAWCYFYIGFIQMAFKSKFEGWT
jgi:hypothetical protein